LIRRILRLLAGAAIGAGLAACSTAANTTPSTGSGSTPVTPKYALEQVITVPGFTSACASTTCSFDISFIDGAAQQYYLADRTNKGVSVITTYNNTYLGTAGKGAFVGINALNSNGSGPNGVLSIGGGVLYAGDGNSTVKVLSTTATAVSATVTANIPTINPTTTGLYPTVCGGTGTPTTGIANNRADEMAYDPTDHVVLVINDAACPPFGTFISTTTNTIVGSVAFPTAGTGGSPGAEQPTWDAGQGAFLVAIPSTTANPGGEVDVISPTTYAITKVLSTGVGTCNPNGTALGKNETLFLGCSGLVPAAQIVTISATTGALINTIAGIGGCDEVWYNPTTNQFFGGCSNNPTGPVAVVADGNGLLLQAITTSTGAHSIAVDPSNNRIFSPQRATPNFGVAVYGY
jgi:hypothetical protein